MAIPRQTLWLVLGHASILGAAPVTAVGWAEQIDYVRYALERWPPRASAR